MTDRGDTSDHTPPYAPSTHKGTSWTMSITTMTRSTKQMKTLCGAGARYDSLQRGGLPHCH
uniref:Uncharacterized protein n=1 Tax=Amphimedon queenslandica TaxID=400682 RepID=A0A1X7VPJ9_AMPQE